MSLTLKNLNPKQILKDVVGLDNNVNDMLRSIEWDKKYQWRIKFVPWGNSIGNIALSALNIPPQFLSFFPVSDIDVDLATVTTHTQEYFMSNIKVPLGTQSRSIRMTFYDDVNATLRLWFENWMNVDILNCGLFTSCLYDSHKRQKGFGNVQPVRKIMVEKLNEEMTTLFFNFYDVFVEDSFSWNGSNDSAPQMYTVSFVIVKDYNFRPTVGLAAIDTGFSDLSQIVSKKIFK
jgi:hypothetical protein